MIAPALPLPPHRLDFDPATDAAIPMSEAVVCAECDTVFHSRRHGGRCPCGSAMAVPLCAPSLPWVVAS
jgi:hypothetical protein